MIYFLLNIILWSLALYGLLEIIKTIIYSITYIDNTQEGIYIIVGIKNQEDKIEGFLRSYLFKTLYGKEEYIKEIIIADLNSIDRTREIAEKISKENECIKVVDWEQCKNIIDNLR